MNKETQDQIRLVMLQHRTIEAMMFDYGNRRAAAERERIALLTDRLMGTGNSISEAIREGAS